MHDRTLNVSICGRICINKLKINFCRAMSGRLSYEVQTWNWSDIGLSVVGFLRASWAAVSGQAQIMLPKVKDPSDLTIGRTYEGHVVLFPATVSHGPRNSTKAAVSCSLRK